MLWKLPGRGQPMRQVAHSFHSVMSGPLRYASGYGGSHRYFHCLIELGGRCALSHALPAGTQRREFSSLTQPSCLRHTIGTT